MRVMIENISETCPICGEKMERGYVYHGGGIFWSKEKQKWFPRLEPIQRVRFVGYPHFLEGYRCSNCKIVIFSYKKVKDS